ncbi:MAG: type IV pilus modification PilV family protein [Candidatus Sumerlaeota bacterium]
MQMSRNHIIFTGQRAMTLLEVLIASTILVMVSVTVISSMTYSNKTTRLNTNAVMAKNIAQGYFEKMNIDFFKNVHPLHSDYTDITTDSANPVYLDETMDMRCAIDFEFKGFGEAESGSESSITDSVKIPGISAWETDEWVGHYLYLVEGPGMGQYAEITGNDADTLNVASGSFSPAPDTGTGYMIDNGKTVRITTSWNYMGKDYIATIGSLIINYRNQEDLGLGNTP